MGLIALFVLAIAAVYGFTLLARGPSQVGLEVLELPSTKTAGRSAAPEGSRLKALTLNIAHGRRDRAHQALLGRETVEAHLRDIARMLIREAPDIAALQESDGPSLWSGKFSHVEFLAREAGYPFVVRGDHVKGPMLRYGTALMSRYPLTEAKSITFEPSPPTFAKGFVVATAEGVTEPGRKVDIVSVHLDFSRREVRERQVKTMLRELAGREVPAIIMGDFNCEWSGNDPLQLLAEGLDLRTYRPSAEGLDTFPALRKRLDWILVSPVLGFVTYRVVPDVLSDHQAVVAELQFREEGR